MVLGGLLLVWGVTSLEVGSAAGEVQRDRSPAVVEAVTAEAAGTPAGEGEVARAEVPVGEGSGGQVVVVGRCVLEADGAPVAGARMRLVVALAGEIVDFGRARRFRSPVVASGVDGRFAMGLPWTDLPLEIVAQGPWAGGDERVYLEDRPPRGGEAVRVDLGDIELTRGFPVRGRVVNHEGVPVRDGLLTIGSGRSALLSEGRFDLGYLAAGEYEDPFQSDAGAVVAPRELLIGPERDTTDLLVTVDEASALTGTVIDADSGRPVSGFSFEVEVARGGLTDAVSGADGLFRVPGEDLGPGFARILAGCNQGDESSLHVPEDSRWYELPAHDVVVRVRPWPEFLVRAIRNDGLPLQDPAIWTTGRHPVARHGPITDGVTRFRGGLAGRMQARITAERPRYAASTWFEFDPSRHRIEPLEVRLLATIDLRVEAVIAAPAAENLPIEVSLLQPSSAEFSSVRTDRVNRTALLPTPEEAVGWQIQARSGRATGSVTLNLAHLRDRRVEVRLVDPRAKPAGTIALRIVGVAAALDARVLCAFLGLRREGSAEILRDLALRFTGLEPGDWLVVYRHDRQLTQWGKRPEVVRGEEKVLARVALRADEEQAVAVDLPHLAPGRITGVARHRGVPLRRARLMCSSVDGSWIRSLDTDEDGRFNSLALPPDTYRFAVSGLREPGITSQRGFRFPQTLVLGPGEQLRTELDTGDSALRVRVLLPDGTAAVHQWFQVEWYGKVRTDAEGVVVIQPAPGDRLHIESIAPPEAKPSTATIPAPFPKGKVVEARLK